jgi:hypothetical protein
MLTINGLALREGGGVFYLLSESEERRLDAGELRRVLHTLVDRVELDPKTRELSLHYRLNVKPTGVKLASQRGLEPNSSAILVASWGTLAARAPRSNAKGLDESVSKE